MRQGKIFGIAFLLLGFSPSLKAAPSVRAIAAGTGRSLALASDGTVWEWGSPFRYFPGQLDDGPTAQPAPAPVKGLSGITAIAAGDTRSLALKNDGTIWMWGSQMPLSGLSQSPPVAVAGLSGATAVAVGCAHNLAAKSDGTVWSWGGNNHGELGDGTYLTTSTPVQVSGVSGVVAVAAGCAHSLVLKSDGTVWGWGHNGYGQVGDGTTTPSQLTPVAVSGLGGVVAVAEGFAYSLALKSDGTVWAWGENGRGQLGDGTTANRPAPVQVSGLSGVVAIAAGFRHSLAATGDGTVWAWGANDGGQLGDGTTESRLTPVQVSGMRGAAAVAAGGSKLWDWAVPYSNGHSLALKNDGTLWAWGSNEYFQLGDGSTTWRATPVQASGLDAVKAIAAGGINSLAVKRDGTLWTWGWNLCAPGGDCKATILPLPTELSGLTGVIAVAGGEVDAESRAVAVSNDGSVWEWGQSYGGGWPGPTPAKVSGIDGAIAVAAGESSFALKGDGTVWEWGPQWNPIPSPPGSSLSQSSQSTPVQVPGLSGVTGITVATWYEGFGDFDFGLALRDDGSVLQWGEYGVGATIYAQVSGLTGVVAVAAGAGAANDGYGLALRKDWAWQLWGETGRPSEPVQVAGLTDVVAITVGDLHNLAVKRDGTVWAWGNNAFGQLGDGTTTDREAPVQVAGLSAAVAVAARGAHSLALLRDGTVWAWGDDEYGQLGDGRITQRTTPVQVVLPDPATLSHGRRHSTRGADSGADGLRRARFGFLKEVSPAARSTGPRGRS